PLAPVLARVDREERVVVERRAAPGPVVVAVRARDREAGARVLAVVVRAVAPHTVVRPGCTEAQRVVGRDVAGVARDSRVRAREHEALRGGRVIETRARPARRLVTLEAVRE